MQPLSTSNSDSGHEITPILHTESTAVHSPHLGSRSACVPPARPFQDAWILLQLHLPFADSKQRHGEPAQLHPLRSGPSFRLIHHRLIRQLQLPRRRLAATHRNAIKTIPLRFIRTDHNIPCDALSSTSTATSAPTRCAIFSSCSARFHLYNPTRGGHSSTLRR